MKKRAKLNMTETKLVQKLIQPGFVLVDENQWGVHTEEVVISREHIPNGEKVKTSTGIHIRRTTTMMADKMCFDMGLCDTITNEPIVKVEYFTRPVNHISFEKFLTKSQPVENTETKIDYQSETLGTEHYNELFDLLTDYSMLFTDLKITWDIDKVLRIENMRGQLEMLNNKNQ
jgi:hypothetical protein